MAESKKAPKVPQDHKKKADGDATPKVTERDGGWDVRYRGVDFRVEAAALNDFELMDTIAAVEDGQAHHLPGLLRGLIGEDGYKAALGLLRDEETGRVSLEQGAEFVWTLFGALNPNS